MKRKAIPWWVEFTLKYWQAILGLGAMGIGLIVFLATLNPRLSAEEKKNVEQDKAINKLAGIEEFWKNVYEQNQQRQAPPAEEPSDEADDEEIKIIFVDGKKLCCDGTDCWAWNEHTECTP